MRLYVRQSATATTQGRHRSITSHSNMTHIHSPPLRPPPLPPPPPPRPAASSAARSRGSAPAPRAARRRGPALSGPPSGRPPPASVLVGRVVVCDRLVGVVDLITLYPTQHTLNLPAATPSRKSPALGATWAKDVCWCRRSGGATADRTPHANCNVRTPARRPSPDTGSGGEANN